MDEENKQCENIEKIDRGLAMELLIELKTQNERIMKALIVTLVCWALTVGGIVGGFVWYLNQYDFQTTIEQTGLYTFIDSKGNVVTSDLTDEQIKQILEILNKDKE